MVQVTGRARKAGRPVVGEGYLWAALGLENARPVRVDRVGEAFTRHGLRPFKTLVEYTYLDDGSRAACDLSFWRSNFYGPPTEEETCPD